jgi:hypothetical protein
MSDFFEIPTARCTVCVLLCTFAMTSALHAQTFGSASPAKSIAALKQIYLDCERIATRGGLDTAWIMGCSVVYEELKQRAFDGDFKRLKAWADTQLVAEGY